MTREDVTSMKSGEEYADEMAYPDNVSFFEDIETNAKNGEKMRLAICVPESREDDFELSKVYMYIARFKANMLSVRFYTDWEPNIIIDYEQHSVSFAVGDSELSGCSNYMDGEYKTSILEALPLLVDAATVVKVTVHLHQVNGSVLDTKVTQFLAYDGPPVTLKVLNTKEPAFTDIRGLLKHPRLSSIIVYKDLPTLLKNEIEKLPSSCKDFLFETNTLLQASEHETDWFKKYENESKIYSNAIDKHVITEPKIINVTHSHKTVNGCVKCVMNPILTSDDVYNNMHTTVVVNIIRS